MVVGRRRKPEARTSDRSSKKGRTREEGAGRRRKNGFGFEEAWCAEKEAKV